MKRRILHEYKVYYPDVYGGIPYVIRECLAVRPDLFEQALIVCGKRSSEEPQISRVKSYGNILSLPMSPMFPFRLWKKLRCFDLAVLHAPFPLADLVHAFDLFSNIPFIVYWHADVRNKKLFGRMIWPLVRRTLERARLILVSDVALIEADGALAPFRAKVTILPFPIDVSRSRVPESKKQKLEQLKKDHPRLVVAVGRLVPYKGFDVLIRAATDIDAQVVIIGEGPERSRLEGIAIQTHRSQGKNRVTLLGALPDEDLACYLNAASVFVLPSVSSAETFGVVQLEAMAAGLPIINTRLPTAVPHIARDMIEGLTVDPGDSRGLAMAVNRVLNDTALHARMSAASLNRAFQFSSDVFEKKITEVFEKAISP